MKKVVSEDASENRPKAIPNSGKQTSIKPNENINIQNEIAK